MIAKFHLITFLLSLPFVRDYEHVRLPIPRSEKVAEVIATAAFETDDPISYAIDLDVLGAHESAYNVSLVGDHHGGIARSCGAWQTPCEITPGFARCDDDASDCKHGWRFTSSPTVALAQARRAVSILRTARENCPGHEIWRYASGQCARSRTASLYEEDVKSETEASTAFLNSR